MNFSVRAVSGFKYDPLEMYPITGLLLVCHLADVDPSGCPMAFHPTGRVHRVAKEAIARHFGAYHSSHHVTCVDAYPNLRKKVIYILEMRKVIFKVHMMAVSP